MNQWLFIFLLFALQLVCFYIGRRASKSSASQEDYFLAGKSLRFFPLLMTFVATQVGGGIILGAAEEAYRYGWIILLYPFGQALGFVLLACGIGKRLAQLRLSTVAQLFEVVYKSLYLKYFASILSMTSLFMILVAQFVGSRKFMLSLGIDSMPIFLGCWAIVILYTSLGGLKAVVATDIVQATFFLSVFACCFFWASSGTSASVITTSNAGTFDFDASKLCGWLLMPLLFMVIGQDMAQRCFAAESPRIVTKATLWSAIIVAVACIIPVYFGVLGKSLGLEIPAGSSVLMATVSATTNPFIASIVGCSVIAAVISTADALINAIGSNLAQDFNLSKQMRSAQFCAIAISLVGLLFSLYCEGMVGLMIESYHLSVSCLFIPVIAALFRPQSGPLSAGLAVAMGAFGFCLFHFVKAPFPKEIACVLLSALGYAIGEYLRYAAVPAKKETRSAAADRIVS